STAARDFYTAGGTITARQNGLAVAGDYLSAASFLGTIAVFFSLGTDGLLYAVGAVAGWPIATFLIGERLRNLGRYTFSDALGYRLSERPVRFLAAVSTLCLTGCYLIAQLVGAGALVQTLFGIPCTHAIVLVGLLMMVYVTFGGMVATTWIQIIKATLLLITSAVLAMLVFGTFGMSLDSIIGAAAAAKGYPGQYLLPGRLVPDGVSAISLGLAFALGPTGLPHILMRFFTVKDAQTARRSLSIATTLIALFQLIVIVLGYAAAALISSGPLPGGPNMASIHLARILGGELLLGITAAVTFATILAVVSGLMLAAASAVSHDLYKHFWKRGLASETAEIRVSRLATVLLGAIVMSAAVLFQRENVGFLATLPLVIAASVNSPILILAMYWRGLTTAGAVAGGMTGLILSVALIVLSNKVWVDVLGHAHAAFGYEYPTVFSLGAALLVTVAVSVIDRSKRAQLERQAFAAQFRESERGPALSHPPGGRSI
ncbi:MAG: cation/acetate symporter ActP, partial [Proteobacteria bacterium]|nr:cation/acetate symporter ActP [Pseudomonadota bacterium]